MAKSKNKKNFLVRYFTPFGLRQVCDILMIVAAIMLIVGLSVACNTKPVNDVVLLIGLCIYVLASALSLITPVKTLFSKINHRAPEYKRALTNTVVFGIIFALSVFALIYLLVA